MAETPNPINDAPPSTLEVENLSVEEALLKKLPLNGELTTVPTANASRMCLKLVLASHKNICKIGKQKAAQKNTLHAISLYHSMTLPPIVLVYNILYTSI